MTHQEIDEFAAEFIESNPGYKKSPEAVSEIRNHSEYSHSVIKNSWEANWIYFHCENSPTGSWCAFVVDKEMLKHLHNPIDLAINGF